MCLLPPSGCPECRTTYPVCSLTPSHSAWWPIMAHGRGNLEVTHRHGAQWREEILRSLCTLILRICMVLCTLKPYDLELKIWRNNPTRKASIVGRLLPPTESKQNHSSPLRIAGPPPLPAVAVYGTRWRPRRHDVGLHDRCYGSLAVYILYACRSCVSVNYFCR